MATIRTDSSFISWNLTEAELKAGSILSSLQKQCIQNIIWQHAEEKLALTFKPENLQLEAELQGRILALKSLLDLSQEQEKELVIDTPAYPTNSQEN
jgi:hypothetical protein